MPPSSLTSALALAVALSGLCRGEASAAPPPPPRGPLATVPSQAPVAEGVVARNLTTPYGDPNGLRLADGTLVLFPPHVAARIGGAAAPGDRVRVIGQVADDGVIRAAGLVNLSSGASVGDEPSGPPAPLAARPSLQRLESAGTIDVVLRGPRGEANGVILTNGDIIYFRPDLVRAPVAPAKPFAATGIGTRGAAGISLEAITVGADLSAARAATRDVPARPARPSPPGPLPAHQP